MSVLKWNTTPDTEELTLLVITYYAKGKRASTSNNNNKGTITNFRNYF